MKNSSPSEKVLETVAQVGSGGAKAALNLFLPGIGGALAELLNTAIAPLLARRRDRFMEEMARDIEELKEQMPSFSVEALANNEAFCSTFLQAAQAAMRTHQEEKLKGLR